MTLPHTHPTRGLPRAAAAFRLTRILRRVLRCASEQADGLHVPSTCASRLHFLTGAPGCPLPACCLYDKPACKHLA